MGKDNKEIKKEDKVKITRDRHGKTYFWCACNGHMVSLWWDDEFEFDLVELSFWDNPVGSVDGWKQRLIHIWHIIRSGTPFADHISFDADEAELFIETLKDYVVKARGAKEKAEKHLAAFQLKHMDKEEKSKDDDNLGRPGLNFTPFTPESGGVEREQPDAHFGESDECDCNQCMPEK